METIKSPEWMEVAIEQGYQTLQQATESLGSDCKFTTTCGKQLGVHAVANLILALCEAWVLQHKVVDQLQKKLSALEQRLGAEPGT